MSRKQAPTVMTGGEMGQIIDHLLCASDASVRMQDARDALALHLDVVKQRDDALLLCIQRERRINTLELVLINATHDFRAAMQHNDKEKKT